MDPRLQNSAAASQQASRQSRKHQQGTLAPQYSSTANAKADPRRAARRRPTCQDAGWQGADAQEVHDVGVAHRSHQARLLRAGRQQCSARQYSSAWGAPASKGLEQLPPVAAAAAAAAAAALFLAARRTSYSCLMVGCGSSRDPLAKSSADELTMQTSAVTFRPNQGRTHWQASRSAPRLLWPALNHSLTHYLYLTHSPVATRTLTATCVSPHIHIPAQGW